MHDEAGFQNLSRGGTGKRTGIVVILMGFLLGIPKWSPRSPRPLRGRGARKHRRRWSAGKNPVVFDGQAGSRVADTENNDDLGEEAALPAENSKGKPGDIHSIRVRGFWHSLEIGTLGSCRSYQKDTSFL